MLRGGWGRADPPRSGFPAVLEGGRFPSSAGWPRSRSEVWVDAPPLPHVPVPRRRAAGGGGSPPPRQAGVAAAK